MGEVNIGIDFGTQYVRVGIFEENRVKLMINTLCNVSFDRRIDICIHNDHLYYSDKRIFDFKRLIGLKYDECVKYKEKYPFKFVKSDSNNRANVEVLFGKETRKLYMEEIYALVLRELVKMIEQQTKKRVTGAVIAIPNVYTDIQRQAVLEAAYIANLDIIQLIHESTAIAIKLVNSNPSFSKNVLIVDIGAGKLDMALVKIVNANIEVLVNGGIKDFGGNDFTYALVNYCIRKIEEETKTRISNEGNEDLLTFLFKECEKFKFKVADDRLNTITINAQISILQNKEVDIVLNKNIFLFECQNLYVTFENYLKRFKQDIEQSNYRIDVIFLTGCSSPLLKIGSTFKNIFNVDILPDRSNLEVVNGAILLASKDKAFPGQLHVQDVISKDLLICDSEIPEIIHPSIKRYNKIGQYFTFDFRNKKSFVFNSTITNQECDIQSITLKCWVDIRNSVDLKKNTFFLAHNDDTEYEIIGFLSGNERKNHKFSLRYNLNGILEASNEIIIEYLVDRLNSNELESLKLRQIEIDDFIKERDIFTEKKTALEMFCYYCVKLCKSTVKGLSEENALELSEKYESMRRQINQKSTLEELERIEYDVKRPIAKIIDDLLKQNQDNDLISKKYLQKIFYRLKKTC